jgi:hypothetical protein
MEMDFSPRSTSPMNFPLSPEPLPLAQSPQSLSQKPPHVFDGALCHGMVTLLGPLTVTTFSWLCNQS